VEWTPWQRTVLQNIHGFPLSRLTQRKQLTVRYTIRIRRAQHACCMDARSSVDKSGSLHHAGLINCQSTSFSRRHYPLVVAGIGARRCLPISPSPSSLCFALQLQCEYRLDEPADVFPVTCSGIIPTAREVAFVQGEMGSYVLSFFFDRALLQSSITSTSHERSAFQT
jgi:hypothetical protein